MLKLIWLEPAVVQLETMLAFVAEDNEAAADRLQAILEACAERIPDHPYMHRPGRVHGTREAVAHPNYILIYRVTTEAVEITNLVHARQRYP